MANTAATGWIGKIYENLRVLISNCPTFQTWTGTASAAEALERIHFERLPNPRDGEEHTLAELQAARPFAILGIDTDEDGMVFEKIGGGAGIVYRPYGRMLVTLEDNVNPNDLDDPRESFIKFANNVDGLLTDFDELAGTGTYIHLNTFGVNEGPFRALPDEIPTMGDYWRIEYFATWGVTS